VSLPTIPIDSIHPHPSNARHDLGDLTELAASIRAVGLLQPLVVTQTRAGWRVIDGHRRLAAARLAGAKSLPCIATKPGDTDRDTALMLAAAMHKQLEPIERARAFTRLRATGLSVTEIAHRTGYAPSTVSAGLLLAKLPPDAAELVDRKTMTVAQATDLARQLRDHSAGETHASTPRQPRPRWLTSTHPLADTIRRTCTHHQARQIIGGVGCGQCWEQAIRDDEISSAAGGGAQL